MKQPSFTGLRTFLQLPAELHGGATPDVTIVGAPFDLGTTNRPGARFGPSALRDASILFVEDTHMDFRVDPTKVLSMVDRGDLKVANGYLEETIGLFEEQLKALTGQVVVLGGDHLVTLPTLRALRSRMGRPLSLVHFDAHMDTWETNFGTPLGHGTPFRYAAEEGLIDPAHSLQIGIRAPVDNATHNWTLEQGFYVVSAEEVHISGPVQIADKICQIVGERPAYLTFDVDGIDPSQAPGTGTPEVGGLFTWQVMAILKRLGGIDWRGMDLVEVAPAYDHAQITSLAGASIIWTYLCLLAAKAS